MVESRKIPQEVWIEIEAEYNFLISTYGDMTLIADEEIERERVSRQSRNFVKSALLEQQAYSYKISSAVRTSDDMCPAKVSALIEKKEFFDLALNTFHSSQINDTIRDAIATHVFSQEFVTAWNKFLKASGVLMSYFMLQDNEDLEINRQYYSQETAVLQEVIYASWMLPRWVQGSFKRETAEDELANAIHKIVKDPNYDVTAKNILYRMIHHDKHGMPSLVGRYLKYSKDKLVSIIETSQFKVSELPVLDYDPS